MPKHSCPKLIVINLHHFANEISDSGFLTRQMVSHVILYGKWQKRHNRRPVGLVVWFSLRVREVPGSTPGQALFDTFLTMNKTSKRIYNGIFDVTVVIWNSFLSLFKTFLVTRPTAILLLRPFYSSPKKIRWAWRYLRPLSLPLPLPLPSPLSLSLSLL